MVAYERVRTDFGGAGYRGLVERYSDHGGGDFVLDESYTPPLVWSRGSFSFDTSEKWFLESSQLKELGATKVYKDHDFLLEFRSWRYHVFGDEEKNFLQPPGGAISLDDTHITSYSDVPWYLVSKFMELSTNGFTLPLMNMVPEMDHVHAPSLPTNPVVSLLGRTNPVKPGVDIPAFVGELRDFPRLFKTKGLSFAGSYLNWNFGWKPLLKDLSQMILFGEGVTKRLITLRELLTKGITRYARWDESVDSEIDFISCPVIDLPEFAGLNADFQISKTTRTELWGYTRWHMPELAKTLLRSDDDLQRWTALKSYYGLNDWRLHPAAAWEIIPWSWLIDWFGNFQTILEVTNYRAIPVDFGGGGVCRRRTTKGIVKALPGDYISDADTFGFAFQRTTKEREIFSDVVNAVSLDGTGIHPFSDYQLSILVALLTTYIRRK